MDGLPAIEDIYSAADRIASHIHKTPVLTSRSINGMAGSKLYFKCENLQRSGAFKMRGAMNALLCLNDEQRGQGVITHSSGNHAGALALAAQQLHIPCHIVMPENAPECKKQAVLAYGASITYCAHGMPARIKATEAILARQALTLIHPFDDADVIAGQGTVTLELLSQVEHLDAVVMPIGGGGLLAGCCSFTRGTSQAVKIYGVEPELVAEARTSLETGVRQPATGAVTIADGLQAGIGALNFALIQNTVETVVTVSEAEIVAALRLIWERLKLVVEPSAAVALAAIMHGRIPPDLEHIGIILTGGNIDMNFFDDLI